MFRTVCVVFVLIVHQHVHCAMRKSWKSVPNFDAEIPKFTPFNDEADLNSAAASELNEVKAITQAPPSTPLPSPETLTSNKISSKIKAPSKYIADIYNQLHQQNLHKNTNDFGAFNANVAHDKVSSPESETESVHHETASNDQIDIEQVLNQLTEEAVASESTNDVDTEDELEISSITSEDANTNQYKVGQLMNLTIDNEESSVHVNLDQNKLKEIFTGSSSQAMLTTVPQPS